ncbi:amino acid/amide ABC transporter substrate-binding protein, HAAT family [Lutibacter oricola]|uniref:Amino acid/amide ABC transporter substrate-binding protein, HAAT family n=1 Tax=Lutibacter oricola TaxID=762486 RepID=A0A1H3B8B9_9FLAO|nr:LysM peptidoglycan-binding domain-containing protein [Lutibacter oricola]SDX38202.1 amino acid/amide ABC transporter substrate-binding protein, HAAT family [Lutibacter oricola]
MNRIRFIIVVLLISSISCAQQKKYISYTVKKGETIKAIAKDYNMSTKDLLRLNPDVSRKPRANTVIIVPNKNYGKKVIDVKPVKVAEGVHVVKAKETFYGISKQYGISIEELKKANNGLVEGLKPGMHLTIPKPIQIAVDNSKYQVHAVVKDDTIYNLTKRYAVTEAELLKLNPTLSEGLKLGMVLRIKPLTNQDDVELDSINSDVPKLFVENIDASKTINVVLMLPYQINKMKDSLSRNSFNRSNSLVNISTDFHLGAQMAIDSLKSRGVNVHLDYFDTENSPYKLQSIVSNNNFDNVDVVIGPLFYKNALWVAKNVKAPVIAPMYSSKQNTLKHSNLIKSAPDKDHVDEHLIAYLKENYKGENVIVINDGKKASQTRLWRTVNEFKKFDSIQTISVVKPLQRKDKKQNLVINNAKLIEKFSDKANNWIILVSDENETTASAINSLKTFESEKHTIKLFAFNKGRNFDKIDNVLLGNLNFTYPSVDFLSLENTAVKSFYNKYRSKNSSVPTKYALKGFDITYDAVMRLVSFDSLEEGLKAGESRRLTSMFRFDKKILGAFENNGVHLIQYNKELSPVVLE